MRKFFRKLFSPVNFVAIIALVFSIWFVSSLKRTEQMQIEQACRDCCRSVAPTSKRVKCETSCAAIALDQQAKHIEIRNNCHNFLPCE